MTKYRESKAALTSKTYDRNSIEANTENIYEALSIISKRSQQINLDIKKELHEKLEEFATHNDSLEEIFENKEQIKGPVIAPNPKITFNPAPAETNLSLVILSLTKAKIKENRGNTMPASKVKNVNNFFYCKSFAVTLAYVLYNSLPPNYITQRNCLKTWCNR